MAIRQVGAVGAAALLLAVVGAVPATAGAQETARSGRVATAGPTGFAPAAVHTRDGAPLLLPEAVARLPLAVEQREGYRRELYRHWNRGPQPDRRLQYPGRGHPL
ncbi:hypothetical protein ACWEQL_28505 [Kitasatospora sp. NPDC004240]